MFNTRDGGLFTLGRLRGEMDRLFSDFLAPASHSNGGSWEGEYPALNVWEDEGNFYAEAELPGYKLDDLAISVVRNELLIKGERKPVDAEGRSYHRQERAIGNFSRVLQLPTAINADRVEATLTDGVLFLKLPKAEEAKPRKIQVTSR